jgi:hypothetical protein
VLVRKKNGDLPFCVEYRRMKDVTKKDCFLLPRVDKTLDTLAGAKRFPSMDLKIGYWKVALLRNHKEETAFSKGQAVLQFTAIPFVLCFRVSNRHTCRRRRNMCHAGTAQE